MLEQHQPETPQAPLRIAPETFAVETKRSTTSRDVHALVPTIGGRKTLNLTDTVVIERDPVVESARDADGNIRHVVTGTRLWMKAFIATFGTGDARFVRSDVVPAGEDVHAVEDRLYGEIAEAIRNQA